MTIDAMIEELDIRKAACIQYFENAKNGLLKLKGLPEVPVVRTPRSDVPANSAALGEPSTPHQESTKKKKGPAFVTAEARKRISEAQKARWAERTAKKAGTKKAA